MVDAADKFAAARAMEFGMGDEPQRRERILSDVTQTGTNDVPLVSKRALDLTTVPVSHYDLVAEHARGGIGRVLRAEDLRLCRTVAVKELLRDDLSAEQRFLREARVT